MTLVSTSVPSWILVKAILEEKPYLPRADVLHAHQSDDELRQLQGDPRSPHEDRVLGGARHLHDTDGGAGRHRPAGRLRHGARRGRLLAGVVQRGEGPSKGGGPARASAGPTPRIINELAKRLGLEDFWEDDHEALDAWLAPSGLSFEDLKHHRTLLPKKAYSNANLRTPSGKVEIVAESLADIGLVGAAHLARAVAPYRRYRRIPAALHEFEVRDLCRHELQECADTPSDAARAHGPDEPRYRPRPGVEGRGRGLHRDEDRAGSSSGWCSIPTWIRASCSSISAGGSPRIPRGHLGWDTGNINMLTSDDRAHRSRRRGDGPERGSLPGV